MLSGFLVLGQRAHRRGASTALVAFVILARSPVVAEAQGVRDPTADSSRSISDALRPAPLGLRALDGGEGAPGVLGSVDTTTVPLLGAGEPLEALVGALAGVRVYRPSGEPGELPLVALHGRTTVDRKPSPLYVFDGVPLAAPPIDIVTPGLSGIDVLSAQLGASWLGSAAHDGVIHLRTGALSPPPTGFATRVRSEVGGPL